MNESLSPERQDSPSEELLKQLLGSRLAGAVHESGLVEKLLQEVEEAHFRAKEAGETSNLLDLLHAALEQVAPTFADALDTHGLESLLEILDGVRLGDVNQEKVSQVLALISGQQLEGTARVFRGRTFRNAEQRIGRNDPCPCGCGKKAKKCPNRKERNR